LNLVMALDDLRTLIAAHARTPGVTATSIPGVAVSRMERPGPQDESTTGTILAIVAQGAKRLTIGDSVLDYGAGDMFIASVDLPVSGQYVDPSPASPALGFGIALRPEVVAELMLSAPAADVPRSGRGDSSPPAVAVAAAPPDLIDAATRMLRLLDRPSDAAVLAPMIEREIHWLLMSGPRGATVRQLGLADSSVSRVRHAVRWIRDHYTDAVRVDQLAQLVQMSPSAFHRNFHAVTAMSPIQFQKQIRLQEARIRLLAAPGDIAGAAFAVGYESASQFSREYRRQFGAPPSRDVAALRDERPLGAVG
jgi:AraC-like DNA-binding protein